MANNEVIVYEGQKAIVETRRLNYAIRVPGGQEMILRREVDFGVIPNTKKPSLFKAGAEKVCFAYGLMQRYAIESKIEEYNEKAPFFHYIVRCDLVKLLSDGREIVFASALGSCNTAEKSNGFKGAFDSANSALKKAEKRALVAAALTVCGGSDMFTQDIEDETINAKFESLKATMSDESPITPKQTKVIFAKAYDLGMNAEQTKKKLAAAGYSSTKDIKQKDFEAVLKMFEKEGE